jgi:methyl-accepting chemotaxis protein
MSQGNSAAIRRRAGVNVQTLSSQPTSVGANSAARDAPSTNGLTLQQVISVIGSRLTVLETFMNSSTESNRQVRFEDESSATSENDSTTDVDATIRSIFDEFNHRFELLAKELGDLKDIVIKLQSFTMDVNKTLLQERIQVFSELDAPTYMVDDVATSMEDIDATFQQDSDSTEIVPEVAELSVETQVETPVALEQPTQNIGLSIETDFDTNVGDTPSNSPQILQEPPTPKSNKKREPYHRRT